MEEKLVPDGKSLKDRAVPLQSESKMMPCAVCEICTLIYWCGASSAKSPIRNGMVRSIDLRKAVP